MKLLFIMMVMSQLVLVGCKEMESLENDIESISELKTALPFEGPYSYEDNEDLAKYFSGLNQLVKEIEEHPKGKKGLDKYLEKNNISRLCEGILISKHDWLLIKNNCQAGDYFICSEDIVEFENTIQVFSEILTGENRDEFISNDSCAKNWQPENTNDKEL